MKYTKTVLFILTISLISLTLSSCVGPDSRETDLSVEKKKDESIIEQAHEQPPEKDLNLETSETPKKSNQDVTLEGKISMTDAQKSELNQQAIPQQEAPISATQATIETSKGQITVKLYPDSAPQTVQNFLTKAESGYYENLNFHRVENWVIQGGDPKGNGTGGGQMATELSQVPFKVGSLGVARGGNIQISNDSQFFICTDDCSWLSGQYTNFGEVIEGFEVAKQIAVGDKILKISYQ